MTTRMPMPADDDLTAEQRRFVVELRDGPRGRFEGPFVPLLRRPELGRLLAAVGADLRYGTDRRLTDQQRELAILLVARHWRCAFEWEHHRPLAERAGLRPADLDRLHAGAPVDWSDPVLATVAELAAGVLASATVDDERYAAAVTALGEDGTVELLSLLGYYTTLAFLLNAAGGAPW